MVTSRRLARSAAVCAAAVAAATASPVPALASTGPSHPSPAWVSAWQGSPTAGGTFNHDACPSDTGVTDQTVRNLVTVTGSGGAVRVRVSNAFGGTPLRVDSASVAIAGSGAATRPGTLRPLRFAGGRAVVVPAGGEAFSDPVPLPVHSMQRLALSLHLPGPTGPATQHGDAQATSYLAAGNQVDVVAATPFTTPLTCWMFTTGVDVRPAPAIRGTVVALGDSITDSYLSTIDADRRYPDDLARRLAALPGPTLAVSNAGISGNEVLHDRVPVQFGVSALHRLSRDVLHQAGARAVILMEGINDIGAESATAASVIAADKQIIARVHAAGIRIYGATLVPFGGSNSAYGADYGTAAGERERQALNQWIRTAGAFDGVFDLDKALRDPQDPTRLLPAYDSGDHLHPGDAGYQAMADAIDLRVLVTGRKP